MVKWRVKLGLVVVAGLMEVACGGGGNTTPLPTNAAIAGSGPLPSSTTTQSSVPPVTATSMPAATYTGASLSLYTSLNAVRSAMGVGALYQSTALDTAAANHALYLATQTPMVETHIEVAGAKNFYAATPYARAMLAGFVPTSSWVDEALGDASNCMNQLMDTVYHAEELTSNIQTIGIGGMASGWACVLDVGTVTGTAALSPNTVAGIPATGGQQLPAGVVAVYPYNGQTGVPGAMSPGENPAPPLPSTYTTPGHPVLIRVRVDNNSDTLTASQFSLQDANHNVLMGTLLVNPAAFTGSSAANSSTVTVVSDSNIAPGVVIFVPQSALNSASQYTVTFSGARDAVPVTNTSSSFTTQ